jgi:hypothetical protein
MPGEGHAVPREKHKGRFLRYPSLCFDCIAACLPEAVRSPDHIVRCYAIPLKKVRSGLIFSGPLAEWSWYRCTVIMLFGGEDFDGIYQG